MKIAYCMNVVDAADVHGLLRSLDEIWHDVRELTSSRTLGFGLWLPHQWARQMVQPSRRTSLVEAFRGREWCVPTWNGFPFGNFHQERVKFAVYQPTWWQTERRDYTIDLANLAAQLAPPESRVSISTLPIAWRTPAPSHGELAASGEFLRQVARAMHRLSCDHGIRLCLCLEPEPGCALQSSDDVIRFLQTYVWKDPDERLLRTHLGVCHDICHSAVLFEEQQCAIGNYEAHGVLIGKVQVSSAVVARFPPGNAIPPESEVMSQLRGFAEDRYLHQTVVRSPSGGTTFFDDLPDALARGPNVGEEWRIHFHVPIHHADLGSLGTTQFAIRDCLQRLVQLPDGDHVPLEIETYAWSVLPPQHRADSLAIDMAAEISWLSRQLDTVPTTTTPIRGT